MGWRIREATGKDSDAAAAVVRAVYEEYGFTWEEGGYHADLYDLETHYLACGDRFWVAELHTPPSPRHDGIRGEGETDPLTPQPPLPAIHRGEGEMAPHPSAPSPRQDGIRGEGEVVATCGLELFERIPGEPGEVVLHEGKWRAGGADCSLERLYVHPDARRLGIGAALFETCLAEARSLGRSAMEIWSDKEFGDAHRLYERYGARVIGERICDDPDQAEEWGLVLVLAADR